MKIAILDDNRFWITKILECIQTKYKINDIDIFDSPDIFLITKLHLI